MARLGVWKRGCTRAIALKSRPSSAIAKKMRGAVMIDPLSVPKVESITVTETKITPAGPTSRSRDIRGDELRTRDLPDVEHGEVREVREQIDGDHGAACR